ncbi:MAG: terminase small subunit [Bacteroidota bacterium]
MTDPDYPHIEPTRYPADYYLNSPANLWSKANAYFAAIDKANETAQERIPFMHSTLAKYLGISYEEWQENQSDLRAYSDFVEILNRISLVIHADQIEGALLNVYPEDLLNETYWKWHESREEKFKHLNNIKK